MPSSLSTMVDKKTRRTKSQISDLRRSLYSLAEEAQPCTVRQLYYLMVSAGLIQKTEADYHNVVIRLLGEMRENDEMPWHWITDSTRWMRRPRTFSSLQAAVDASARDYRRSLWDNQGIYLEVWCEKLALLGVFSDVTDKWDVPLMIARGFSSKDFTHSAAEQIVDANRPTYIYQVGDHDPSGLVAWQDVQNKINRYTTKMWLDDSNPHFGDIQEIVFVRIAVTEDQIQIYHLPTRPTKTKGNTHAKNFEGESVEADALPPNVLRELVNDCIEQHVDQRALHVVQVAEESERKALEIFAKRTEKRKSFATRQVS
jgi:hypothetical protein